MSRRVYLLGVGLALVALGLAVTDWTFSLRSRVTEESWRRIRPGMTPDEVTALIGKPHSPSPRPLPSIRFANKKELEAKGWAILAWEGPDGSIYVLFNSEGRAIGERYWIPSDTRPGLLARLRAWLGW